MQISVAGSHQKFYVEVKSSSGSKENAGDLVMRINNAIRSAFPNAQFGNGHYTEQHASQSWLMQLPGGTVLAQRLSLTAQPRPTTLDRLFDAIDYASLR